MARYKNITEPDQWGYQVRVVINGKEHSRYFSHRKHGGRRKSLRAAVEWRDDKLAQAAKERTRFRGPQSNNHSTRVAGVSRVIKNDKRKGTQYVVYQVFWMEKGKPRNKSFSAGPLEQVTKKVEEHTLKTAVQFRREYEQSVLGESSFRPLRFRNWRNERLYD